MLNQHKDKRKIVSNQRMRIKTKGLFEKTEFEETSPTKNEKSLDIAPSSSAASSEVKLKKEIGAWTNSLHGHQSKGY